MIKWEIACTASNPGLTWHIVGTQLMVAINHSPEYQKSYELGKVQGKVQLQIFRDIMYFSVDSLQ